MTLEFIGTCSDRRIASMAEIKGRRFSYKRLVRLLKDQFPDIHYDLALQYYNPWSNQTKKIQYKGIWYIAMVHSQIDYLFKIIKK